MPTQNKCVFSSNPTVGRPIGLNCKSFGIKNGGCPINLKFSMLCWLPLCARILWHFVFQNCYINFVHCCEARWTAINSCVADNSVAAVILFCHERFVQPIDWYQPIKSRRSHSDVVAILLFSLSNSRAAACCSAVSGSRFSCEWVHNSSKIRSVLCKKIGRCAWWRYRRNIIIHIILVADILTSKIML